MKDWYLFCNLRYGRAFMEAFARSAARHPDVRHTVVLSTSHLRNSRWDRRMLGALAARREAREIARPCLVQTASDINMAGFVCSIAAGSHGIVAGFNQILGQPLIDRFDRLVNFHPSILPHYRGAIPSYWALRNGERRSGFTVHQITAQIDAGPFLYQQYVDIPAGIDEGGLDGLIARAGAHYLEEFLDATYALRTLPVETLPSPYHVRTGYLPATRMNQTDAVRNR